jgi:hypothetical protein
VAKSAAKSLEIPADYFPQENPQEIDKFLVVIKRYAGSTTHRVEALEKVKRAYRNMRAFSILMHLAI